MCCIISKERGVCRVWIRLYGAETELLEKSHHYLLVHSHCIQPVVHDVDPAVLTGQHKQRHQRLDGKHREPGLNIIILRHLL